MWYPPDPRRCTDADQADEHYGEYRRVIRGVDITVDSAEQRDERKEDGEVRGEAGGRVQDVGSYGCCAAGAGLFDEPDVEHCTADAPGYEAVHKRRRDLHDDSLRRIQTNRG